MFYDKFCDLCSKKGVSPSRAAIEAGFSKSLLSKWKADPSILPSSDVLKKVADYFGVTTDWLLGKEKQPTAMGELSDEEKAMLDLFRQAGDDAKRLALLALEHGEQK